MSLSEVAEQVTTEGGVLVGDDGSDASREAVCWAAADAVRRGVPLHVLRSWSMQTAPRPASWSPGYVPPLTEWEASVHAALERRVRELVKDIPGVEVRCHPVHAGAVKALIAASGSADLIVVGSRGHGGFAGLLLGSVAEQVVRHAKCPVVVVRPKARR